MKQTNCPKCGNIIPSDSPQSLCPKCLLKAVATEVATTKRERRTAAPTLAELAPHFPELQIQSQLGIGGMGVVYKAYQQKLDRFVALKILSDDLASDPAFVERFNREARVLARLHHPNIVAVFDCGAAGPYCYLIMEYVDGVNLRQAMHAGKFTPSESLAVVEEICMALNFAHAEGILHRDIKPENILIDTRGRVKIADFGIAKLIGSEGQDHFTLTTHGAVLGSPHYMAPEQFEAPGDVDARADIYSLGVVFYELLTRELPIGRFAPPSAKVPMDQRIDEIVMRTLEKERQVRYQSADEFQMQVKTLAQSLRSTVVQGGSPSPIEVARYAVASAVFTILSLLLGALAIGAFLVLDNLADEAIRIGSSPGIVSSAYPIVLIVGILGTGVPASIGIIFGSKALREVRAADGRKRGVAMAMIGVLSWPIILTVAITGGFAMWVLGQFRGILSVALLASASICGILAIVWIVRSLLRWVKNDTK